MNRRTLIVAVAAVAATPVLNRVASAQISLKTKNVVFVHGLFADGSCWSKVIERLQQKGVNCTSVQNPLTSLSEASEAARRAIAAQPGPTVLVGHSFSGMIVSDVGVDPKVTALVYAAARAPDAGEDYTALAKNYRHLRPQPALYSETIGVSYPRRHSSATSPAICRRGKRRCSMQFSSRSKNR